MAASIPRLCVVVPTFHRAGQLSVLLRAIAAQDRAGISVELVVIDNDPEQSAKAVVEVFMRSAPFPVSYDALAEPGFSNVRNRALAVAEARRALLVMIDDDETPAEGWLGELVAVQRDTGADAVIGPVLPVFPPDAPTWITAGRFFDLARAADRCVVDDGYTGNCLIRVDRVRALGVAFDREMNLSGGEDQLFFRHLYARGGRIAYAAHAIAREAIPPGRLKVGWLLRRNMRKGNTLSICDRKIHGTPRVLALRAAKAFGLMSVGVALFGARAWRAGTAGVMRSACDVARGFGMGLGLIGLRVGGRGRRHASETAPAASRTFAVAAQTSKAADLFS